MRERRADIEAVKGLAIMLVVFGHLVARQDPAGVSWYEPLRRAVYAFHMPLFLYLSGLVAAYSGFLARGRAEWAELARQRARRLLVPFFGMGLLVLLGKLALSPFMFVDHVPPGFWPGLRALVWDTGQSPALFIWYLFVLCAVSLLTLLLLDGRRARLPWLLAGALLLYGGRWPAYVYLDRVFTYAPFFLMGAVCGMAGAAWEGWMDRVWPWALALLVPLLIVAAWDWPAGIMTQKWILLGAGTVSLPAIHGLLRAMPIAWLQRALVQLGRYCFVIYLFNTIFIGLAKALLMMFCSWNGAAFAPFAAGLMAAGLAGPVVLKRYGLRRPPWLDRMTD